MLEDGRASRNNAVRAQRLQNKSKRNVFYEKLISMVLACSMVFTMGINAFASNNTETTQTSKAETVMVELENGKVIPVEVTEITTCQSKARDSSDGSDEGGLVLGCTKTFTVDVYNDQIEAGLAVGAYLSAAAATQIAGIATSAIAAKLLEWGPLASNVTSQVANQLIKDKTKAGSIGTRITLTVVYDRVYYHAGGYYVNCFSYKNMSHSAV